MTGQGYQGMAVAIYMYDGSKDLRVWLSTTALRGPSASIYFAMGLRPWAALVLGAFGQCLFALAK